MPATIWSTQQEAIFTWFKNSTVNGVHVQHLIARARAGTGKSTTIRQGVLRAPENTDPTKAVLIAAFSKNIQLDMEQRFTRLLAETGLHFSGAVKTLHAVGYACIRRFRDNIKVSFDSVRADKLTEVVCGVQAPDAVKRLVSKLHTKGREIAPHAREFGDLSVIQITFECEPEEQWEEMGFGAAYVEEKALEAMELAAQVKSGDTIDGSDMIFLPVRNGWLTKQYDLIVVDEAQDMTPAQLEVALGVLRPGGRVCIVGDDRQAIFGFRGADSESLDRLKSELGAAELGLTTTYRCGRVIVELARGWVKDFEAGPNNCEGIIDELPLEKLVGEAGPGDFVLSRVNAPLVAVAMRLLRAGKRARVAGRDIGKGLTALARKMKARSVSDFLVKVEKWAGRETEKLSKRLDAVKNGRESAIKAKMEAVADQAAMLTELADGARNVAEIEARVEALFTDDGLGAAGVVTCSSVHRAKGLEADRVFILSATLRNTSIEEQNICYVAVTRAKQRLTWVNGQ